MNRCTFILVSPGHSDKEATASSEPEPHTWGVAGCSSPKGVTGTHFAYEEDAPIWPALAAYSRPQISNQPQDSRSCAK
jgi:hypothetical protein